MKAVSVRELKNNPSAALRAAHEDPVIVLKRQRPEAVLVHLDGDSFLDEPGIRLALATALYREQNISLGRAARFAGLPLAEFIQYVSQLGIPVIQGTAASVREDTDAIQEWRKSSSSPTDSGRALSEATPGTVPPGATGSCPSSGSRR